MFNLDEAVDTMELLLGQYEDAQRASEGSLSDLRRKWATNLAERLDRAYTAGLIRGNEIAKKNANTIDQKPF